MRVNNADAAPNLEGAVVAEAVREHYRNQPIALFASAATSAFTAVVVAPATPTLVWVSWLLLMYAQVGVRLLLLLAYQRGHPDAESMARWGRRSSVGQLVSGLVWGAGALVLNPSGAMEVQLFLTVMIAMLAITAGGAFATLRPAFLAFYLPCMLPLPFALFSIGGNIGHVAGLTLLIYTYFFGVFSLRVNRGLLESIRLRLAQTQLAEQLAQRTAVAEAAAADKSRFLAAASHDLRQPLHALALFVDALKSCVDGPSREALVRNIEQSLGAMDSLFHALLDISKLDAGVVRPVWEPFPVQALLDDVLLNFSGPAQAQGLRLLVRPSAAWVRGDRLLCGQMLANLVSNALRYTRQGGVLVACRRERRGGRDGRDGGWRIVVLDTGIGIAPEQLDEVFKEFVQIGNPERDRRQGLGLGLAIVRRIADLMRMPVHVRSRPGRGSTFGFSLPRAEPQAAAAHAVHGAVAGDSVSQFEGQLTGCLVAVLDDEIHVREGMQALLQSWGAQVVTAPSCAALIAGLNAQTRAPDVLVCDYRLQGGASGITAVHEVREEFNSAIPALLVTGDTAPDRLAQATASGLPLLHKPVQPRVLRRMLSALARQGPQAPQAHADRV
ncbi:ATP-binding response regulator [Hylemonella gracilis]|uniref:histidine kinase n=1 Tax=Hylemonella gracilis ATCC 19624 TaxID=887062 RepID=F3KPT2_9BURK|nr:hybrid sensor histidine kinase/response regulator [Hylemonella gracilis]EGI78100.1 integral membrane sensor hybrid histidine kinase [Hylemonella gracilis ATCC 19624]